MRVTFDLPTPVTSLVLRLANAQAPANIVRAEQGFTFRRGRLSAANPFRRVSLRVTPDTREVDSVYPMLREVRGAALVIYAPYFLPAEGRARVRIADSAGGIRTLGDTEADGYVTVGAMPSRHRGYRALVAEGVPAAVAETLLGRSARLLAFYRARLRRPPLREPTIIISYLPRPEGSPAGLFRGDVTPNGVVFLRLYVDGAQLGGAAATARHTGFLAHELFHLWNRSRDPNSANWWLHEGGAEYASWVAIATLWPGEPALETHLVTALRTCTTYLGPQAMGGLGDLEGRGVRYPCGAIVQWVVDAGARARGRGGDIFAVWARMLAATARRGSYTPRDFRTAVAALAPAAVAPFTAIVDGTGNDRWGTIAQALTAMGARVDVGPPSPFALRLAAARALVLSECSEVYGVGDGPQGLFVQAPETCATFADSPVIEQAGGVSPMQAPGAFHEAVLARIVPRAPGSSLRCAARRPPGRIACAVPRPWCRRRPSWRWSARFPSATEGGAETIVPIAQRSMSPSLPSTIRARRDAASMVSLRWATIIRVMLRPWIASFTFASVAASRCEVPSSTTRRRGRR